jgi:phospholipid/cholesterol/gamma-HCH transport system permease protein
MNEAPIVTSPTALALRPFRQMEHALIRLGDFMRFGWAAGLAFSHVSNVWKRRALILRQCELLGLKTIGVITVAGIFIGAVMGYQLYVTLQLFGAEALLGGTIGVSLFRELAPVMAAVMVTGNAGAAMAAELASMRISEQIDALDVMAVDPMEYLVLPRVLSGLTMLPLISIYFAAVGTLAAAFISCGVMGLDSAVFWTQFAKFVDVLDISHCLIKSAVFGLLLSWIACFQGFNAYGGARAVGQATRSTVVLALLSVLFADYIITSLLPFTTIYWKVTS